MARIIQLGDRHYLAGMRWVSYTEKPDKADIQENASRFNANWHALREGAALQSGFCEELAPKIPSKLESLAARLAEARIEPWMGVFEISVEDDLYWYIAVRDQHAILPNGDVIGTKAEILDAQQLHQSYDDWKYVEGDSDLLQSLLQNTAKATLVKAIKLSTVTKRSRVIASCLTVGIVAASIGGYFWYESYQAQEKAQRLARQKAALDKQNQASKAEMLNLALKPMLTLPLPHELLLACRDVLYSSPVSDKGWIRDSFLCSSGSAIIFRKRGAGASVSILPSDATPDATGETATQSTHIKTPPERKALPALVPHSEASFALRGWAQRSGLPLTLTAPASIMPKRQATTNTTALAGITDMLDGGKKSEAPLPYLQSTFAVTLKFAPFDLQFEVPGLFIKSIKTTTDGYVIEGVLYGKRG